MKPWHRWMLFAASVPCIMTGLFAMHEAWWMTSPGAAVCVLTVGLLIFGVGMALISGAVSEDEHG